MSDTSPDPEPVIRTTVQEFFYGTETTIYENDVMVSVRTDFTEAQHTGTRFYITYYDATGAIVSTHEVNRNGITRTVLDAPVDDTGVYTRTFLETDPENVERWLELRYVERLRQAETGDPMPDAFLGSEKWQANDDGSSFGETRDQRYTLVSQFDIDSEGRTTTRDFEDGAIVVETLLDPSGTLGFVSRVRTFENGATATEETVFADHSIVRIDQTGAVTVRTEVGTLLQGKETHVYHDDVLTTHRVDFDVEANPQNAVLTSHYDDATGEVSAFEVVDRDGTTLNVDISRADAGGVRTRTVVQTDPKNARAWTELRTVTRYTEVPSEVGNGETIVSAFTSRTSDDGSSETEAFGENLERLSTLRTDGGTGVTTILDYADDRILRETILDPRDVLGFVSKVTILEDGVPLTATILDDDGSTVTTDYAAGLRTRQTTTFEGAVGAGRIVVTFDEAGRSVVREVRTAADGTIP